MLPETPLGPLKRRDDEPAFDEAWQAQALGMADLLVAARVITADAWSEALGAELRASEKGGSADTAETYYRAVLAALETLLYDSGVAARQDVDGREADWRRAYLSTPHGEPVRLDAPLRPGQSRSSGHD